MIIKKVNNNPYNKKITCSLCKKAVMLVTYEELKITNMESLDPLLSFRYRPDGVLGLRCECGNYTILSDHKKDDVEYQSMLARRKKYSKKKESDIINEVKKKRTAGAKSDFTKKTSLFYFEDIK